MKKLLWLLLLIPFMGCMTANQLAGEQAYYQAMVAMQTQKASQPIFELVPAKAGEPITLGNVGSFKVFAPPANSGEKMSQYVQKDYVQPWLNVVSMAVPWLGAWGITNSVAGAMKDMGNTTTNITGNANKVSGPTNSNVYGSGNYTGHIDQTATPTVVTQPPPIVVVVDPVVVNPVIVP